MNEFETISDLIMFAHRLLGQALSANHNATPLHQHYFTKMVSDNVEEFIQEFDLIVITPNMVTTSVEIAFDMASLIADTGGLVRTTHHVEVA